MSEDLPSHFKKMPNLQEFMQKNWKWIQYRGPDEVNEFRSWNQEDLVLDPIYSMLITECNYALVDNNQTNLAMLSPMFKQEMTGQDTATLRRKIDCTDLVTKYLPTKKFTLV
jgi:hypothetical protein